MCACGEKERTLEEALDAIKIVDPAYTPTDAMPRKPNLEWAFDVIAAKGDINHVPVLRRITRHNRMHYAEHDYNPEYAILYGSIALGRAFHAIYVRQMPDVPRRVVFCANRLATLDKPQSSIDFYEEERVSLMVKQDVSEVKLDGYVNMLVEGIIRREIVMYTEPYSERLLLWRERYVDNLWYGARDNWVSIMKKHLNSPDEMVRLFTEDFICNGIRNVYSSYARPMDIVQKNLPDLMADKHFENIVIDIIKRRIVPWLESQLTELEALVAERYKHLTPEERVASQGGSPKRLREAKVLTAYYRKLVETGKYVAFETLSNE